MTEPAALTDTEIMVLWNIFCRQYGYFVDTCSRERILQFRRWLAHTAGNIVAEYWRQETVDDVGDLEIDSPADTRET